MFQDNQLIKSPSREFILKLTKDSVLEDVRFSPSRSLVAENIKTGDKMQLTLFGDIHNPETKVLTVKELKIYRGR